MQGVWVQSQTSERVFIQRTWSLPTTSNRKRGNMSSFEKKWEEIIEQVGLLLNRANITDDLGNTVPADGVPGIIYEPLLEVLVVARSLGAQEALQRVEKVTEELKWNHTMARGARVDKRYNLALDDLLAKLREEYK